jgi:hypothetical protein
MTGRYLVDLGDVLRGAGLIVIEWSGWQTRARASGGYSEGRPWCVMWHHTASTADPADDAAYCAYGDPDAPICNLLVDRTGTVWLIAAGATNTNGKGYALTFSRGTVPDDAMNTYAVGVEICNSGVGERYPAAQIDAAFQASLAICAAYGLAPTDVAQHHDWAPDRKIDPARADAVQGGWAPHAVNTSGSWSLLDLRAELDARAQPVEDETMIVELTVGGTDARFLAQLVKQNGTDMILWAEWVNGTDPAQLARLDAYRQLGVPRYALASTQNLAGVGLLGPIPTGDTQHHWTRADFGNVM